MQVFKQCEVSFRNHCCPFCQVLHSQKEGNLPLIWGTFVVILFLSLLSPHPREERQLGTCDQRVGSKGNFARVFYGGGEEQADGSC